MKKTILSLLLLLSSTLIFSQQKRIGDPGVEFNQNDINRNQSKYPQMNIWKNAGVQGGIPYTRTGNDGFNRIVDFTNAKNSDGLNAAINQLSNQLSGNQKGLIMLPVGTYTINKSVRMKSGVSLKGRNRNTVVCMVSTKENGGFHFENIQRAGLYTMTIRGDVKNNNGNKLNKPRYPWNYGLDQNFELRGTGNENTPVFIKDSKNCWVDKVNIINAAKEPIRVAGPDSGNNTLRDLYVDGSYNKAGSAQGYFFILSGRNLITGCKVTHLRHISLQGDNAEFNVVYDNDFRQEVSFHSGDNGNNLIENNIITLPKDMPPIVSSEGFGGELPANANSNKPDYFPIMGPWAKFHSNSKKPNWIYRNKCQQLNHNKGGSLTRPWSDNSKVYTGPRKKGLSIQERISNFPASSKGTPLGGKLYAVTNVRLIGQGSNGSLGYGGYQNTTYNFGNGNNGGDDNGGDDNGGDDNGGDDNGGGNNGGSCSLGNVETMNNMNESGFVNNYTYSGNGGINWTVVKAKIVNNALDGNTSKKIFIRQGNVGIKSSRIAKGISSFCVRGQNLFFNGGETKLELLINDRVVATKTTRDGNPFNFRVNNINVRGRITIALRNASNQNSTILIDNISWNRRFVSNNLTSRVEPIIEDVFDIKASPNSIRAGDMLDVEIDSFEDGEVTMELFNSAGQRLYQRAHSSHASGINNVQLNTSEILGLSSGAYYLRVSKGPEQMTKTIIIKN
ncbi:T9SS type A sorting domain-containing protein [uncultured Croceitalea sp.]|uniref:T9SS type A sorting domain-containing protein n=1 Tax=uncultured Croceitalea sp. TaxID=1798908 RepID=UPI00374F213B